MERETLKFKAKQLKNKMVADRKTAIYNYYKYRNYKEL
jgi:hypothetical protein